MSKIYVKNYIEGPISISDRDLRVNRTWNVAGQAYSFEKETLTDLLYQKGVRYMFLQGLLGIDKEKTDKDIDIEDFLDNVDLSEILTNVILNERELADLLTKEYSDFTNIFECIPREQQMAFARIAIEKECNDLNKCNFIEKITKVQVLKMIQINREIREAENSK